MSSNDPNTIDNAMRTLLRELLVTVESSAERVISGIDPDDIHDVRVAARRTRALLSQVQGAFDKSTTKSFISEFKRIGSVTGNCRDLDVWLETIREGHETGNPSDLKSRLLFQRIIQEKRDAARLRVEENLSQSWFRDLVHGWGLFLDKTPPLPLSPKAARTPNDAASAAILKAHQRLLTHGDALPIEPSASAFHRLRIDGKKLRYLLESFSEFFEPHLCSDCIDCLKRLQDVLGGINDREVQLVTLESLTRSLAFSDRGLNTVIARHRQMLQQDLTTFRSSFFEEFRTISEESAVRSFQRLFQRPVIY